MVLRSFCLSSFIVIGAAAVQPPASQSDTSSPFPPGPGRDALIKVCGGCHGPESAVAQFKTHDEWTKTLDEMANNGAQGSDEEWNQIAKYLDKHYTLIFVNKAGADDLATTLDVTTDVAEAIVGRRTEKGPFKTVDDLKTVPGLTAATIDVRKDRLIF